MNDHAAQPGDKPAAPPALKQLVGLLARAAALKAMDAAGEKDAPPLTKGDSP